MLNYFRNISFWYVLGLGSWILVYLLRKNGIVIPFFNGYFTDLISIPMYCYTIDFLMNLVFKSKRDLELKEILFSATYISILFEIILPKISSIFIPDVWDVVCYFVGGLLYYFIRKSVVSEDSVRDKIGLINEKRER